MRLRIREGSGLRLRDLDLSELLAKARDGMRGRHGF